MMHKLAIAAPLALFFLSAAAHGVIIDTFDTSQSLSADSGFNPDLGSVIGAGILGTERDSYVQWDSGDNTVDVEVNASSNSLLNFSSGADTMGYADFVWDGPDGSDTDDFAGLGGVDLTAASTLNSIALKVAFDDLPVEVGIAVATDAGNISAAVITLPGGIFSAQTFNLLFSSFVITAGAGADFTDINAILLYIESDYPATDLQLDFIESAFVPEPSSLALAALGLIGVVAWGRRRKPVN